MNKINEKEWQAEADAELMARYEELMTDAVRVGRARKAASKKADQLRKGAERMSKVSKKK